MEDKCKACGGPLYLKNPTYESPLDTTEVKSIQEQYCPNANCIMFDKLACRKETVVSEVVKWFIKV